MKVITTHLSSESLRRWTTASELLTSRWKFSASTASYTLDCRSKVSACLTNSLHSASLHNQPHVTYFKNYSMSSERNNREVIN